MKKGVLLINLGSPHKPERKWVRKFLREFLNDKHVIDIPGILRFLLVNLIIVPFRTGKSTRLYQQLWDGSTPSPIYEHTRTVANQLQKAYGNTNKIYWAMRYGSPNIKSTILQIKKDEIEELTILPLYPQYAQSTTQSVIQKTEKEIKKSGIITNITYIPSFFTHDGYINALVSQVNKHLIDDYDRIIFSFHGLPNRHVRKMHPNLSIDTCDCSESFPAHGQKCYRAQCFATQREVVKKLSLPAEKVMVGFQSNLNKRWLSPYTSDIIEKCARNGDKKLLLIAPSFVSDNLETLVEIDKEYTQTFIDNGGEKLTLVEGLNNAPEWIKGIQSIINTAEKEY